jgi:hypothetical protein
MINRKDRKKRVAECAKKLLLRDLSAALFAFFAFKSLFVEWLRLTFQIYSYGQERVQPTGLREASALSDQRFLSKR